MADAESEVKKGRIRHCYPRREIYHRFIHSEEYAYTSDNHRVSCKGNYMVIGDIGKKVTINDIEELWYYNSNRMIAIIDRNLKRILINKTYKFHVWDLEYSIPSDYTIYFTDEIIPEKDILSNTKKCLKIHSKYLIKEYVERNLIKYYSILYANKKTIHNNIKEEFNVEHSYLYKSIFNFVKDNDIKKYDFYKECFDIKYKLRIYTTNWSSIKKEIKLPTLKQIITGKVFNKKEMLLLEQHWFWTKYCYGNHIPFKDVVDNWNKEVVREDIIKYLKRQHYIQEDWFTTEKTWNEYIIKFVEVERKIYNKLIKDSEEASYRNYEKAQKRLKESNKLNLEEWRNHKTAVNKVIYAYYIRPSRRNMTGRWVNRELSNSTFTTFDNIQLRLSKDGKRIQTSRWASVTLEEGIKMYKFFKEFRNNQPNVTFTSSTYLGNIKVGIYNFRLIHYKDKFTDSGKSLGKKEWCIQIGCHALWLDDINDFIRYYHLEDKFGLINN